MIRTIGKWAEHWSFWFLVVLTVMGMEGTALFYQYILEEMPCKLCVHVRAYLLLLLISGVLGILWNRKERSGHLIGQVTIYLLGMAGVGGAWHSASEAVKIETSLFGTCSFEAGFPSWMPLDTWFPWIFEPKALCGKGPDFFGVMSLNEALVYATTAMAVIATIVLVANAVYRLSKD
ncbi:disulfide bond formation protein B [Vibrio owensii]|uniref:disulfide bond formation protein B n=1 Tax=Vibrio harveyi group TaxID=717610 RepID=UPI003CC5B52E